MEKTEFYKIGKILCYTTMGIVVLAMVLKKKLSEVKKETDQCRTD